MSKKFRDSAVSEIIGTIIIMSLGIIGLSIVGAYLNSNIGVQNLPNVDLIPINESGIIKIYHNGGESLNATQLRITIDSPTNNTHLINDTTIGGNLFRQKVDGFKFGDLLDLKQPGTSVYIFYQRTGIGDKDGFLFKQYTQITKVGE
ncbi:MAG: type IV pilin N-terminal domain-containing protein [Methanospirillum sp.]|uniref:type IV pilin N-terminal domain-containing protein n=1 Tax=Methanospirillum sp. TaxID=45200 RepID=UPI0023728496|nr:type IV pilin N-terminal domain-containing protein [Methanospirillum sp.]MDD1729036.1 type IV pilin N-terminal domain-containing protein [Methanospirillum sp.]